MPELSGTINGTLVTISEPVRVREPIRTRKPSRPIALSWDELLYRQTDQTWRDEQKARLMLHTKHLFYVDVEMGEDVQRIKMEDTGQSNSEVQWEVWWHLVENFATSSV